ncbi:C40 family peptidase [Atopobium deltae]|uniref:NlpC/P60 family protein n=1 Tax=Atopobium deltae TaxID=1393034 RepID=A0A133XVX1_9ACTN|nr:C40 family peptidase [Atopobium deltae]KXB35079.1 NlpC/P60 family protein [Atopobium deltae]
MTRKIAQKVVAAVLTTSLSVATVGLILPPSPALADPTSAQLKAKLDTAKQELNQLYAKAEQIGERLNETEVQLTNTKNDMEQTKKDIGTKKQELAKAQKVLSGRVAANYKSGSTSILEIILSSSNFEELANNIYYAQKVSKSDEKAIHDVKSAQADLNAKHAHLTEKKQQQEQLLAQQKDQQAKLADESKKAEDYVKNLDQQVKDKMEEERRAAEAAARARAEAARRAAARNNGNYYRPGNNGNHTPSRPSDPAVNPPAPGKTPSNWRNAVIAEATRCIGLPYVWGAEGPGAYDCSGLTQHVYRTIGVNIPHSSWSQASFCTKPASQAVPGDILWRPGHVGLYIGNGATIEAMNPSRGITYGSLSSFVRAGSPI